MPAFQSDEFLAHLGGCSGGFHYYSELESTNDEATRMGLDGAAHGALVLAEYQTKGRGRRGAEWLSAPGEGLMFSIVLRPDFARENWGRIALVGGLGIADVLREKYSVSAMVKWPNDVMISGRKCCGVLVEAQEGFAVLGVGINVLAAPTDCACIDQTSAGITTREGVLAELVKAIMHEVGQAGRSFETQMERVKSIDYLSGKRIQFESGERSYEGDGLGISSAGGLIVRVAGHMLEFNQAFNIRVLDL